MIKGNEEFSLGHGKFEMQMYVSKKMLNRDLEYTSLEL